MRSTDAAGAQASIPRAATSTSNSTHDRADASTHPTTTPFAPVRPAASREKQRLHETFQDDRRYLEQMLALDTHARSDRVDAILELKGSIDASAARLQAQNATRHRRAQELADRDKRAYSELLNRGKNPHEVTRARAVKLAADKERRTVEQRIERKQLDILGRLEIERVAQQRRDRLEQEKRAFEKKYQAEMGRTAVDARTKAYVVSRTGKEQLDPTGKLVRVYPSQETTIKDHSFGLGANLVHDATQRRAIVDKVHARAFHHDAHASPLLLPRVASSANSDRSDERLSSSSSRSSDTKNNNNNNSSRSRDGGTRDAASSATAAVLCSGPTLAIPGRDLRELNHKLAPATSTDLLPPIHRSSTDVAGRNEQQRPPPTKKGFGKPKRSVLEQQMLANARTRQQTNQFETQVVWGKTFVGDAFLADPPVLWFKDYDVGVPLSLTFTLTNVSHSFNHFKLGAMDADVCELFEIVYDKPGRMSAGMSCSLRMTFTAVTSIANDLETFVPVIAQTGAFRIPVKCTRKRAVPVLLTRTIAFDDVVIGGKQTINVTLENRGALPLHFHVAQLIDEEIEEGEEATVRGPEAGDLISSANNVELLDDAVASAFLQDPQVTTPRGDLEATQEDVSGSTTSLDDAIAAVTSNAPVRSDEPALIDALNDETVAIVDDRAVITWDADALADTEQAVLSHAQSLLVYKPDGADTPLRHTTRGIVAPYASALIAFTFTPAAPLTLAKQVFAITFAQEERPGNPHTRVASDVDAATSTQGSSKTLTALVPSSISVTATATPVPIFVAAQTLDLGCCVYDKLYRHQLVVCNRGSVALKIHVRVPKALEDVVEFAPNMGYVQAAGGSTSTNANANAGTIVVQVKFRPQRSMWKRIERKGFGSEALGFVAMPIQVVVPDQVVPVRFVLAARVTSSDLVFAPPSIDFGSCALGHSVAQTVTIENTSRLPQHVGFIKLPPDVRVNGPSDGVGTTLLPFETMTLTLVYRPSTAMPLRTKLCVRSTLGREYALLCTGASAAAPLVLSHSFVRLGATQIGERQVYSLRCANVSDRPQSLELRLPGSATQCLRITPLVSRIEPNASVRLEIVFAPTPVLLDAMSGDDTSTPAAAAEGDSGAGVQLLVATDASLTSDASSNGADNSDAADTDTRQSDPLVVVNASKKTAVPGLRDASRLHMTDTATATLWQQGIPPEERSVHHLWTVLCFHRDEASGTNSSSSSASPLLSLQIETTAIEPRVVATPSRLDFNQVAIGQSLVLEVTLTNASTTTDVLLHASPLHVLGGFRLVNSIRLLAGAGGVHTMRIEFTPQRPLIYEDELEVQSPVIGTLRIPLRGEGINPSLSIEPPDGWLDFRDTLARNKAMRELKLSNASAFPLTYAIAAWPEVSDPAAAATTAFALSGLAPFTFTPRVAMIPAHGSLVVRVVFFPALQRRKHYKQQFRIHVPNESERHLLTVSGRCWEDQLYVFAPTLLDLSPRMLHASIDSVDSPGSARSSVKDTALCLLSVLDDPFDLPPGLSVNALTTSPLLHASLRKPPLTLVLTFDDDGGRRDSEAAAGSSSSSERARTHQLVVGSTLSPSDDETLVAAATPTALVTASTSGKPPAAAAAVNSSAAVGSFELTLVEKAGHPEYTKLFAIEPMKGALNAGQQVQVQVTYSPPLPSAASTSAFTTSTGVDTTNAVVAATLEGLVVSQWIEMQAVCTLRGGSLWRHVPSLPSNASGSSQPATSSKGPTTTANDNDAQQRIVHIILRAKMTM